VKKGVGLSVSLSAKNHLIDKGYDSKNGARPMRRLLQDTLEDHIASGILSDDYERGAMVSVAVKNNDLSYSSTAE
jgi:ATP-dependent Clp protease ATP-binding subunit ClpC